MQALYDNAASEQADLNLSVGIALSKEQIAKLKKDIIPSLSVQITILFKYLFNFNKFLIIF